MYCCGSHTAEIKYFNFPFVLRQEFYVSQASLEPDGLEFSEPSASQVATHQHSHPSVEFEGLVSEAAGPSTGSHCSLLVSACRIGK